MKAIELIRDIINDETLTHESIRDFMADEIDGIMTGTMRTILSREKEDVVILTITVRGDALDKMVSFIGERTRADAEQREGESH